ncbi:hypothetical protein NKG94_05930 [Micromonospora sp. M12]
MLLAVAVNVATGGTLPAPLDTVSWLAWPAVGLLAVIAVGLTLWQQRLADPMAPPLRAAPAPRAPAELPAARVGFAGRAGDLAAIDQLLADGCRVLALVGPPGAGKSALALHLAHDRRDRYPDGQLFAALRGRVPTRHPAGGAHPIPRSPWRTRGRMARHRRRPRRRFRSAVADRKVLIVLDDARDASAVRPLLPGDPGCLVLVTSRRQLTGLPNVGPVTLGGLDDDDGLALLASAAGGGRVASDPEGAVRIVRFCGGCRWPSASPEPACGLDHRGPLAMWRRGWRTRLADWTSCRSGIERFVPPSRVLCRDVNSGPAGVPAGRLASRAGVRGR